MLKMNAEKFLKTEFGAELENCIKCWDLYLTEKNYDSARLCQEQWDVYQMAVKQFYGIKYHFTRTDEYFGDPTVVDERFDCTGTPIIVVDETKGEKVSIGSVADITSYENSTTEYSKVCIQTIQMNQKMIVVYK